MIKILNNLNIFSASPAYQKSHNPVKNNLSFSSTPLNYDYKISEIEKNLSSMGFESYLFEKCNFKNYVLAKSIQDAFIDIQNAGLIIPKGIIISLEDAKENFKYNSQDAAYSDIPFQEKGPFEIYYNTPKYKVKKGFEYAIRFSKESEIYNAKADTYHEFAHCYQACADKKHYFSLRNENFDEKTQIEIAKSINTYATTNKAEFVAEYFTYKMLGKQIHSDKIDIEKLYNECKRPKLNKIKITA